MVLCIYRFLHKRFVEDNSINHNTVILYSILNISVNILTLLLTCSSNTILSGGRLLSRTACLGRSIPAVERILRR